MASVTYNVPLRQEVMKVPRHRRAKKAVAALRQFVLQHSKASEMKIGKYLNQKIWENGIRGFPSSLKIDAEKDDKGIVKVELFGAPKEEKKPEQKKKKAASKPAEEKAPSEIKDAEVVKEEKAKPAAILKKEVISERQQ